MIFSRVSGCLEKAPGSPRGSLMFFSYPEPARCHKENHLQRSLEVWLRSPKMMKMVNMSPCIRSWISPSLRCPTEQKDSSPGPILVRLHHPKLSSYLQLHDERSGIKQA